MTQFHVHFDFVIDRNFEVQFQGHLKGQLKRVCVI